MLKRMTKYLFIGLVLLLSSCGGGQSSPPISNVDTQLPTINLQGQSKYTTAEDVAIDVVVFDNIGVTSVEFYLDGKLKKSLIPPISRVTLGQLSVGSHIIYAKAYDQAGNVASSNDISFSVSQAPTILTGTIGSDTTLTVEKSPYLISDTLTIAPNVTLTLNPGVELTGPDDANTSFFLPSIINHGTFLANGTAAQPVIFKSLRIDPSNQNVSGVAKTIFNHSKITNSQLVSFTLSPRSKGSLDVQNSIIEYTPDFKKDNTIGDKGADKVFLKGNIIRGARLSFSSDSEYINNYITGDDVIIYLNREYPKLINNTIIGKSKSVVVASSFDGYKLNVNLPSNYWGTTDANVIQSVIDDGNDDYGQRGKVYLQGVLTEPHPETPMP